MSVSAASPSAPSSSLRRDLRDRRPARECEPFDNEARRNRALFEGWTNSYGRCRVLGCCARATDLHARCVDHS